MIEMGWMTEELIIVNPFIHCVVLVLWVTGINLLLYVAIRIMWWFNMMGMPNTRREIGEMRERWTNKGNFKEGWEIEYARRR